MTQNTLHGDPADPLTSDDLDTLAGHEAQDAAFDAEEATDRMFERFLAGLRASDELGSFGIDDPAFVLGEQVGWILRGAVALDPDLAPIVRTLMK